MDFLTIKEQGDSPRLISDDDCEVLFAIVHFWAIFHAANPANIVSELPAFDEESFASLSPFAFFWRAGSKGAIFGGGFKAGHEGESFIHGEVFPGERLVCVVPVGDSRVWDFDAFGGWIPGGVEMNECWSIREMLEGEIGGGIFTRGELNRVGAEF